MACDSRKAIVREFLLQSFHQGLSDVVLLVVSANSVLALSASPERYTYASNSFLSSTLALLPTGLMLTIPFRNSTKVPRFFGSFRSAIYFRQKFTKFWYLSSPNHRMKLLLARGLLKRIAVNPFSAKQKSKRLVASIEDVPSCSCCLTRSDPPTNPIAHLWRN